MFTGFLEIVGFTKKMEIQGLLSTIIENVLFFKDFKALKKQRWISSTFKHFKDLYEPCLYQYGL